MFQRFLKFDFDLTEGEYLGFRSYKPNTVSANDKHSSQKLILTRAKPRGDS